MPKSNYVGKTYEGRWIIESTKQTNSASNHYIYIAKNIFNGDTLELNERTMKRIEDGKFTICRLIRRKIFKENKTHVRTFVF